MENLKNVGEELSQVRQATQALRQVDQEGFKGITFKKLRGGFFLVIGYLLSPLSWWNDLIFNLPVAYFFGYLCSLFSPNLFLPCTLVGYWLSNIAGILLMQFGFLDVFQGQLKERNFKKELLMGVVSSTVYTLLILGLVQLKILSMPTLFFNESL